MARPTPAGNAPRRGFILQALYGNLKKSRQIEWARQWLARENGLRQSPTFAPHRRPTSAPTRTATSASVPPSRASPSAEASPWSAEFTDAAVSGADPIETRPGFAALLDKIEGNGVRTVIVEDASRFARELMTQELGILALIQRGVRVLTANGDDLTDSSDPSRKMMRQIAGAFHEYEKARLVAKLKAARERKRAANGKCEGRKSWAEINPELVREAKRLRRRSPKGHQRSLRDVAAELAKLGFVNERGVTVLGVIGEIYARLRAPSRREFGRHFQQKPDVTTLYLAACS